MPRPLRTSFTGARGDRLAAILDQPDGEPRAHALFAHCFTCTKDLKAAHWIAQTLAAQGVATLRFDFAGLGQSEGEFGETTLSSNVDDLLAAAEFMRLQHQPPSLMVGHSLGGVATLAAAGDVPEVRAVCTISSSFHASHLRRHLLSPDSAAPDLLDIRIAGRDFQLRREFLADLERHDMAERIATLGKALLVLHAPNDSLVEIDQAERIFDAAVHPKSFIALDGADHLLSRQEDAEYAGRLIGVWANRYLD